MAEGRVVVVGRENGSQGRGLRGDACLGAEEQQKAVGRGESSMR